MVTLDIHQTLVQWIENNRIVPLYPSPLPTAYLLILWI